MNAGHFDIGTIQAFLDGELAHERVAEVSSHIGSCDDCAMMLASAEDESAVVFSALDCEFNTLVPTHRLWNKISDSIQVEKKNAPFWEKALAFVRTALANPSMTAMAGMILVLGVVALVFLNRTPQLEQASVPSGPVATTSTGPATIASSQPITQSETGDGVVERESFRRPRIEHASYRPARRAQYVQASARVSEQSTGTGYLPGEESYVRTIETLSKTVGADNSMRGSERVAFERDMAVVDDSITKLREQVKKNPKNESAKQVLYSSYQNKIDLLSSVSQKEELMASIGTR